MTLLTLLNIFLCYASLPCNRQASQIPNQYILQPSGTLKQCPRNKIYYSDMCYCIPEIYARAFNRMKTRVIFNPRYRYFQKDCSKVFPSVPSRANVPVKADSSQPTVLLPGISAAQARLLGMSNELKPAGLQALFPALRLSSGSPVDLPPQLGLPARSSNIPSGSVPLNVKVVPGQGTVPAQFVPGQDTSRQGTAQFINTERVVNFVPGQRVIPEQVLRGTGVLTGQGVTHGQGVIQQQGLFQQQRLLQQQQGLQQQALQQQKLQQQGLLPQQGLQQQALLPQQQGLVPQQQGLQQQGILPQQALQQGLLPQQAGLLPHQQALLRQQRLQQGLLPHQGLQQGLLPHQRLQQQGLLPQQGLQQQGLLSQQGLQQSLLPQQGLQQQGLLPQQPGLLPQQQGLLPQQQGLLSQQQSLLQQQGLLRGQGAVFGSGSIPRHGTVPGQGLPTSQVPNQEIIWPTVSQTQPNTGGQQSTLRPGIGSAFTNIGPTTVNFGQTTRLQELQLMSRRMTPNELVKEVQRLPEKELTDIAKEMTPQQFAAMWHILTPSQRAALYPIKTDEVKKLVMSQKPEESLLAFAHLLSVYQLQNIGAKIGNGGLSVDGGNKILGTNPSTATQPATGTVGIGSSIGTPGTVIGRGGIPPPSSKLTDTMIVGTPSIDTNDQTPPDEGGPGIPALGSRAPPGFSSVFPTESSSSTRGVSTSGTSGATAGGTSSSSSAGSSGGTRIDATSASESSNTRTSFNQFGSSDASTGSSGATGTDTSSVSSSTTSESSSTGIVFRTVISGVSVGSSNSSLESSGSSSTSLASASGVSDSSLGSSGSSSTSSDPSGLSVSSSGLIFGSTSSTHSSGGSTSAAGSGSGGAGLSRLHSSISSATSTLTNEVRQQELANVLRTSFLLEHFNDTTDYMNICDQCDKDSDLTCFFPYPKSCSIFFMCVPATEKTKLPQPMQCNSGLFWDQEQTTCNTSFLPCNVPIGPSAFSTVVVAPEEEEPLAQGFHRHATVAVVEAKLNEPVESLAEEIVMPSKDLIEETKNSTINTKEKLINTTSAPPTLKLLTTTMTLASKDAKAPHRSECPKDRKWIRYLDNCYMFSNETADWFTAMMKCKAMDAHLTRIYTISENEYIRHYATNRPDDSSHIVGYWIGGSDLRQENIWEWYETKKKIGPVFWHKTQQNNLNGEQDCLQIIKSNSFEWDDEVCLFQRQYICKQTLNGPRD